MIGAIRTVASDRNDSPNFTSSCGKLVVSPGISFFSVRETRSRFNEQKRLKPPRDDSDSDKDEARELNIALNVRAASPNAGVFRLQSQRLPVRGAHWRRTSSFRDGWPFRVIGDVSAGLRIRVIMMVTIGRYKKLYRVS